MAWSTLSNAILRFGSLALGILLARILSPTDFGVYAIALTVQSVLIAAADLGLGVDLIRSDDPRRIAPTVATVGLAVGAFLTVTVAVASPVIASALGGPAAAPTLAVLGITLSLAGAGVVPYAMLQRRFDQRRIFMISVIDFAVSTTVAVVLITLGAGVLSLAIGRVVAQTITLVLQFRFSGERPRFGLDRTLLPALLRFGLPVAGANVLTWALINLDNIVIARVVGITALGFYVLAFNISTWPMSAIGQVIRSITLPLFSRVSREERAAVLGLVGAISWMVALPAGVFLAVLSSPLIALLYGERWLPVSAQILAALGVFGALRVVFDVIAGFLYSQGASSAVFWTQVVWIIALIPSLLVSTINWGAPGAAWAHLAISVLIVVPAYGLFLVRSGVSLRPLLARLWPPILAIVPAAAIGMLASSVIRVPVLALVSGGSAALVAYAVPLVPWARRRLAELSELTGVARDVLESESRSD